MKEESQKSWTGDVEIDVERAINFYSRHGWAPVPWKNQNESVRAAIRAAGFRPKIKSCFENAQRLSVGQRHVELTYVEGWVTTDLPVVFEHAWLVDGEGRRVDITMSARRVNVHACWTVSRVDLITAMARTRVYGPVFADRFRDTYARALSSVYGPGFGRLVDL